MTSVNLTPAEYARELVKTWPPLTPEQVEKAARILATVEPRDDEDA